MADALIENPILNSPFHEPDRHFKFSGEGFTKDTAHSGDGSF
jgi:type III restriction enzyme